MAYFVIYVSVATETQACKCRLTSRVFLEVWLLRFWEYAVLRRIVSCESDSAMDGAALNISREHQIAIQVISQVFTFFITSILLII